MEMAKLRFLEAGEEASMPKWARLLPKSWGYVEKKRPFRLEREGDFLTGILQTEGQKAMEGLWRKNGQLLLEALEKEGVGIVIPPAEGEWPRGILPFADGRKLTALFAFSGAAEALRRQGKDPAACAWLICGGGPALWQVVLSSMGNEVNRLSVFTQQPEETKALAEKLYGERGLAVEVFSSPKNSLLHRADAILCCGMEQRAYEHILKKGAFWLDVAGNRPVLRRLRELRGDVSAADGFFFHTEKGQQAGPLAEAEAFLRREAFRRLWEAPMEEWDGASLLEELGEMGYAVSGFSALGKRVKILKKP